MFGVSRTNMMRRSLAAAFVVCLVGLSTGCATSMEAVQVQFYAPPGSTVVVRDEAHLSAAVRSDDPIGNRLEHETEDFAVYDLPPGRYRIAYKSAAGLEDATVYGELEIRNAQHKQARAFAAHSFIPLRLPSHEHQEAEHLHPTRDLSYTEGLERTEFDHLRQGDMIEQVYFVADLDRVRQEHDVCFFQAINDIDRELDVVADRAEYLDVRYSRARQKALYRDPDMNIEDRIAHEKFDTWGTEEPFIVLSRKRQALERERESLLLAKRDLEEERDRRNALLRSMRIVHRDGALVLATPDLKLPFRDAVEQASDLGEVVAVLRIGGRHQYWAMSDMMGAGE